MSGRNNIYYVVDLPVSTVISYIRANIPSDRHFILTRYELTLLMLKIMDVKGELDQQSSKILRTPLFGKAFVAEKGDVDAALSRILIDVLPGSTLFRLL